MSTPVLTIDASSLDRFYSLSYISKLFEGFDGAESAYYGGTPDFGYGREFFVNGDQVLDTFTVPGEGEDADSVLTDSVALLEGEGIAYDFIHRGPEFGHGITGKIDSLTFGKWIEGTSFAEEGTGEAGKVTGLDTGLTIEGLGLSAEPGAGPDVETNEVYAFYVAVRDLDADALMDVISGYTVEMTGTKGKDFLTGYDGDDVLSGLGGNDALRGAKGADILLGGSGDDKLIGNLGNDTLRGGSGDDLIKGGRGNDLLYGGAGEDRFWFNAGSRTDTIADFDVSEDIIDLTALGLDGYDDIEVSGIANGIELAAGPVMIRLVGVEVADLTADSFLF